MHETFIIGLQRHQQRKQQHKRHLHDQSDNGALKNKNNSAVQIID
jgi:hypothetical protein